MRRERKEEEKKEEEDEDRGRERGQKEGRDCLLRRRFVNRRDLKGSEKSAAASGVQKLLA